MALKLTDLKTEVHNDWCPGCGDFGIEASLKMALTEMPVDIKKVHCSPESVVPANWSTSPTPSESTHYTEGS